MPVLLGISLEVLKTLLPESGSRVQRPAWKLLKSLPSLLAKGVPGATLDTEPLAECVSSDDIGLRNLCVSMLLDVLLKPPESRFPFVGAGIYRPAGELLESLPSFF